MSEQTKQHIRGVLYLLPLIAIVLLVTYLAEPAPRYVKSMPEYRMMEGYAHEHNDSIATALIPQFRPFDPNVADYRTMIESGVERQVAVSIIKWREAGKVYRIKEDVALCYGMTDSLYFLLEPYICIGEEYRIKPAERRDTIYEVRTRTIEYAPFAIDTATPQYLRTLGFTSRQADLVVRYRDMIGGYRNIEEFAECYAVDSAMVENLRPYIIFPPVDSTELVEVPRYTLPVELNSADSLSLVRLRGIGPKSAYHILRYREYLGGYYSCDQILELDVVTEENFSIILPQICCDSAKIKKIYINFATPNELLVHPYLSNRMLRRIINKRELKGGWSTIEEMIDDNIFSREEAARIAPYLDFGTCPE